MESYEEIVKSMETSFKAKSGYSADEASDIGIRIRVLAGEIYNLKSYIEFVKRQAFPQTAVGEYLDYHAKLRGLSRKIAVKATGSVVFSLGTASEYQVEIPQGTIISTAGDNPVSFETTSYGYIEAGKTTATVTAQALTGGTSGNVASGTVKVIVNMTADDLSVTNLGAFVGGTDEENDEQLRTRIIDSLKFIVNGTNKAYYQALAKSVEGVDSVNVVPKKYGNGTVAVFICGKDMVLSEKTVSQVQSLMDQQREVNVKVSVYPAEIIDCNIVADVTLNDGYAVETVEAEVFESLKAVLDTYSVGKSLDITVINDLLYHNEGIKTFKVSQTSSTGLTALDNEKIVADSVVLREV